MDVSAINDVTDRVAGKMTASDSLIDEVLDQGDLGRKMSDMDEQTAELLGDVYSELSKRLEVSSGEWEAITRLRGVANKNMSADGYRNFVFKAANALGMKLPSHSF